jgi:hypothetical protein
MKNLTILYSGFKRALENSPHIKVIETRNQFDPPNESRKRSGIAELKEAGFEVNEWLGAIIGLSKGNSMTYHVIRDRQNKGEGSFNLIDPLEFLLEFEPWVVKNGTNEADRQLLKKVRVIDQPNVAQTFTGLVMEPGSPPDLPQQLVYFRRGRLLPMSLPFSEYYETLAHFMGIVNWQLLFTDANPADLEFKESFRNLQATYEAFVEVFQDRDFSLWAQRLAAKH